MSGEIVQRVQNNAKIIDTLTREVRQKITEVQKVMSSKTTGAAGAGPPPAELTEEMKKLIEENSRLGDQVKSLHQQITLAQIENGVKVVIRPFEFPVGYDPNAPENQAQVKSSKKEQTTASTTTSTTTTTGEPTKAVVQEGSKAAGSADKKDGKKKEKPAGGASKGGGAGDSAPTSDGVVDISRLDFRVGKIVQVDQHPDADGLYVEKIDLGEAAPRTIVSGLVKHVPIDQMKNRMVIVLCNLKPSKLRGIVSEGMVMCASTPEKVEVLLPPPGCVPGDLVDFEGFTRNPDGVLNPKKKIWETVAPDLTTDSSLSATYKGVPFMVNGKGLVKSESLANVQVK